MCRTNSFQTSLKQWKLGTCPDDRWQLGSLLGIWGEGGNRNQRTDHRARTAQWAGRHPGLFRRNLRFPNGPDAAYRDKILMFPTAYLLADPEAGVRMQAPLVLRYASLGALGVASVFWFWVVASLFAVHWPSDGQLLVAGPLLLAGLAILGVAVTFTALDRWSRPPKAIVAKVLQIISISSLASISGAIAYFAIRFPSIFSFATAPTHVSYAVFPVLGLAGSGVAAILYGQLVGRIRKLASNGPPLETSKIEPVAL